MSFGQWANDYLGVPLEERFNFNPLTYFLYSGIDGAWFDPEDMSTMFQDAAGTTPVTALEQPVGLWLDKSQGLGLGPELTTWAQGFTTTAGVVGFESTVALSGSEIVCTSTQGAADRVEFPVSGLSIGLTYAFEIVARRGGQGVTQVISTWTVADIPSTGISTQTSTTYSYKVKATSSSGVIRVYANQASGGAIGDSVIVSAISVREIKGNHATQSITASRPTLSARYNLLLNSATLSTQSVTTAAAQYTLSFTGTGSVTLSGTATGTLVGTGANNRVSLAFTPTIGTLTLTVTGSVTLAMLAFGNLTTYQAITTATNYDSVGWSRYVRFDGIDDYLNLPYMGLYANGSASVVCAISADTFNSGRLLSESNITTTTPQYCLNRFLASPDRDGCLLVDDTGTIKLAIGVEITKYKTYCISTIDSGLSALFYINSATPTEAAYNRDTPVTLNRTKIGAVVSNGTNNHLTHNNYGLIITKSALSDTDRRRCEQFLASRLTTLGVTLS